MLPKWNNIQDKFMNFIESDVIHFDISGLSNLTEIVPVIDMGLWWHRGASITQGKT